MGKGIEVKDIMSMNQRQLDRFSDMLIVDGNLAKRILRQVEASNRIEEDKLEGLKKHIEEDRDDLDYQTKQGLYKRMDEYHKVYKERSNITVEEAKQSQIQVAEFSKIVLARQIEILEEEK